MRTLRKQLQHVAGLLLAATAATSMATAASPAAIPPMDENLLQMTNAVRTQQGLTPLQWDDALAQAAQAHAELLVQNDRLSHQFPGEANLALRAAQAGAHFQAVAENIAVGAGVESIQKGWMESPPHRANILDPNLNAVGFAVVQRSGFLYAVADFARSVPSLSLDQVEAAIAKLLASRGLQINPLRRDARQTCEMGHGVAGGSAPRFVERWQNSDLSRLPGSLEEELRSGQYKMAAIGACGSANAETGFTTYRVAVLLY